MSGFDYLALDETRRPRAPSLARQAVGMAGLLLAGASAWTLPRFLQRIFQQSAEQAGGMGAGSNGKTSVQPRWPAPFMLPGASEAHRCLFSYGDMQNDPDDCVHASATLHGVITTRYGGLGVRTSNKRDTQRGFLLCWPSSGFENKVKHWDQQYGHLPDQPHKSRAARAVVTVELHEDRSTVEALTYFQARPDPANTCLLDAVQGKHTKRLPVWLFRQAGRHLPEYEKYKKDSGKNFLQMLQHPGDVAEITMQPLRRYDLDAAILFSDILVVAEAVGVEVTMPGGKGIQVPNPITDPKQIAPLIKECGHVDAHFIDAKLPHVMAAVDQILQAMQAEGKSIPLIGFSAAPWTLAYYMLGGSSKQRGLAQDWLHKHPAESRQLLDLLTKVVIEYTSRQIDHGVRLIQIFDAWCEYIAEPDFYTVALPAMTNIAAELKRRHPHIPLMVFGRGAAYGIPALQRAGYDVITMDLVTDRVQARKELVAEVAKNGPLPYRSSPACLQGNLDPRLLYPGTTADLKPEVAKLVKDVGKEGLIVNLGEGLSGKEDPARVKELVDVVHNLS
eukprot:g81169.t1